MGIFQEAFVPIAENCRIRILHVVNDALAPQFVYGQVFESLQGNFVWVEGYLTTEDNVLIKGPMFETKIEERIEPREGGMFEKRFYPTTRKRPYDFCKGFYDRNVGFTFVPSGNPKDPPK